MAVGQEEGGKVVRQEVLEDCKRMVERHFPVIVENVEHVGSRVPRTPLVVALLRVQWRSDDEAGWQFVEAIGSEIYE